ncbi:MAG TPA: DHA2 family efflux MFS transporter permease subunit [Gaiellaceae bacterium]
MSLVTEANRRWWTLAAVTFSLFMVMLDTTIVNVALPAIKADFDVDLTRLEWTVNAFLLAYAALLLPGGKLADFFGRRKLLLIGIAIFTVASLFCGLAGTVNHLIAARAAQGVGAALMMPATHSLISANFEEHEHGIAYGMWAGISTLGLALGPLVGGLFVQHADWPWIFYVNVPLGTAAIAFGWLVIRESRDTSTEQGLDPAGLVVSAGALFALVFALVEGHHYGWGSPTILALFAASAVGFALFILLEAKQRKPMVDLGLFRDSTFTGSITVTALVMLVMLGILFFVSIYLQTVLGFSAVQTGATFLPMTLILLAVSPVAGILGDRLGFRWPVAVGMAVLGASLALFSQSADIGAGFYDLLPALIIGGLGMGIATAPVTAAAMTSVPVEKSGIAAGVLVSLRQTGGALGVAIMGAIVASKTQGDPGTPAFATSFTDGFQEALMVAAGIAFVGAIIAAVTIKPASHAEVLVRAPGYRHTSMGQIAATSFGGVAAPSLIVPIAQLPHVAAAQQQPPPQPVAPVPAPVPPPAPAAAPPPPPAPAGEPALVAREGPLAGARLAVETELTLGREGTDVVLEDAEVSRRHALLRRTADGLELSDLGSVNGTYVNGQRIHEPTPLAEGDVVTLGRSAFHAEIPPPVPRAAPTVAARRPGEEAPPPVLVVVEGPLSGQRITVEGELALGREGTDVLIEDPEVSRRHARVRPVDGKLEVTDLGSVNGTYVNGERVHEATLLADGDTFSLGQTTIRAEIPEAAPRAAATVAAPRPAPEVPPPVLVGREGGVEGQRITVEGDVLLGREGADVLVDDPEVSRQHALVRPLDGGLEITDLGSVNGTYVNGERIHDPRRLVDGDVVTLGRNSFAVEIRLSGRDAKTITASGLPRPTLLGRTDGDES